MFLKNLIIGGIALQTLDAGADFIGQFAEAIGAAVVDVSMDFITFVELALQSGTAFIGMLGPHVSPLAMVAVLVSILALFYPLSGARMKKGRST